MKLALLFLLALPTQEAPEGVRTTRWSADAAAGRTHTEYPRPQMVRADWLSLNGLWRYGVGEQSGPLPEVAGEIRVPFPIESRLSGVERRVGPDERLWYWREFEVPEAWGLQRVLLHFGAVDYAALIHLNGTQVGKHDGGYDPFTIDVTPFVKRGEKNELRVAVYDPTDAGEQQRGKQALEPRGIWYTPVTGIWQTVWLEPVPSTHVERLNLVAQLAPLPSEPGAPRAGRLSVTADVHVPHPGDRLVVEALVDGEVVARAEGAAGAEPQLEFPDARAWSPDDPFLYDLRVALLRGGEEIDAVESYCGLRTVGVRREPEGSALLLNGERIFHLGVLDQGYWPDGLYTAPSVDALRHDLDTVKAMGFNTVRKHVKVEPATWYAHCDRIGLLVWQDLPNGGKHAPWSADGAHDGEELVRPVHAVAQYRRELRAVIESLRNHPSIVMWVPFNEGWGQCATVTIANWARTLDPTRLVNPASGGNDFPAGDVRDVHAYPGPRMPALEPFRAVVLGEFGGLGLPVEGHLWKAEGNWGYRSFDDAAGLLDRYAGLMLELDALRQRGLSGAIYTQLTDVESEVNGLMTYDREVLKLDADAVRALHARVLSGFPELRALLPTSEHSPNTWRTTTEAPAADWTQLAFDDMSWTPAPGGFGTPETPGAVVGTRWDGDAIWLRAEFETSADAENLWLRAHHDEDAELWLDGELVRSLAGFTTSYGWHPLRGRSLPAGRHVLAVKCRQTSGGQFVDAGLYAATE